VLRVNTKAFIIKGIKAGIILGIDKLGRLEDNITL